MINILIFAFFVYTIYKICLNILEINFVKSKNEVVILDKDEFFKAKNNVIINQKFEIFTNIFSFFILVFWAIFGAKFLQSFFSDGFLSQIIFILSFLIINSLISLPLDIYEKFIKDKKLGFSNITPKIFILDLIKNLALTIIFGGAFLAILLWIFENFSSWWIYGAVFGILFILLINFIYPTIIAPLFNKAKPLDNEDLQNSINELLQKCGFKSSGVFVIDASKRDNRLNAYFGGIGNTKRVVLFDTLINSLTKNELLAVLSHELGHFSHKDILKNMVLMSIFIVIFFAILGNLPTSFLSSVGLKDNAAGLIIFFLLFSPILSAFFEPFFSYFSRKKEFGADNFAANLTNKQDIINALKKLGEKNLAFPLSHPLYSAIYHSHPTLFERINELKNI